MKKFSKYYYNIITIENLLHAWEEFLCGKKKRNDVLLFQTRLMDNLYDLHIQLETKTYIHSSYTAFNISDPKPRNIHKAIVRDRVLHHLLYKELYPYFDKRFIHDSFSCRKNKGTHKALQRFQEFSRKVSHNNTRTCHVLKCDIKKFFATIDQKILMKILDRYIVDNKLIFLIKTIVESFYVETPGIGLPLGNLTSQLFVNVYMNEFDQYVKKDLKVRYYIRYADDFVFLSEDKAYLEAILLKVNNFLKNQLHLTLHPNKIFIKTLASGVDFLGWIHFPYHHQLRTTTKRRVIRKMEHNNNLQSISSYRGLLKQGNSYKVRKTIGLP